jgi:hypothetical protein
MTVEHDVEVTRMEIAGVVGEVFGVHVVTKSGLVESAVAAGARPVLVAMLGRLPERQFSDLRQLWDDLPEMPVR